MPAIIDYTNMSHDQIENIFRQIQKRYLDPYTIRLTTETNKYRFVEKEINKLVSTLHGNNIVISGLEIREIDLSNPDYVKCHISKGIAIADNTLIEFLDDIILKVPVSHIDITNTLYNVLFLDYIHVQTYPPKVAKIYLLNEKFLPNYPNAKVILDAFKIDNNKVTEKIDADSEFELNINGKKYKLKPRPIKLENLNIKKVIESASPIKKPKIIYPENDQTNFTGYIKSSSFETSETFYGKHECSDWLIAKDKDFNDIVLSSFNDDKNKTHILFNNFEVGNTYYVKVRYKSDFHSSPWSDIYSFKIVSALDNLDDLKINVNITKEDGVDKKADITLPDLPFDDLYFVEAEIQIATDENFENIVKSDKIQNPQKNITYTLPIESLSPGTYYLRVKLKDNKGNIIESQVVSFEVKEVKPKIELVNEEKIEFKLIPPEINKNWQKAIIEISKDINFSDIVYQTEIENVQENQTFTPPQDILKPNTTYYIRVKFIDENGYESKYSDPVEFKTNLKQIDFHLPNQAYELDVLKIKPFFVDNTNIDTNKHVLRAECSLGSVSVKGDTVIWYLPEVESDTNASITIWVEDKNGNIISTKTTKSLLIKNLILDCDYAIALSNDTDFSNACEFNDGWEFNA